METRRNTKTGDITMTGECFSVIVRANGHLTVMSSYPFTIESHPQGKRLLDLLITVPPNDIPKHKHADEPISACCCQQ